MTPKRKTRKAPAKAGALRRLSDREKDAHAATNSAWGPGLIPRDDTLAVLKAYGIKGAEAEAIIVNAVDPFGRYRMDENYRQKRLNRVELIKQAEDTAAIALELYNRVLNMDPNIRAWAVSDSLRAWDDSAFPESGQNYLVRLHALMRAAAGHARGLPSKVPGRTRHRDKLLAEVSDSVLDASPGLTKTRAREIAGALLDCWGVESPTDGSKVRKAIKRAG